MSANGGFQFTHPGRGATIRLVAVLPRLCVSIHAPREGCDKKPVGTPPNKAVSIHAPREGCDYKASRETHQQSRFNSRTPGGVRHTMVWMSLVDVVFQFTHPGRGATVGAGGVVGLPSRFNSRTPGGVRLRLSSSAPYTCPFQFTHPGRGATSSHVRRRG